MIPGSPKSQRVEYRIAAADANPYVILSAALASGLWGIENKIEPRARRRPATPTTASTRRASRCRARCGRRRSGCKASKMAARLFGDAFVEHFAATREWEEREFRKHITDWELARYFEII